MRCLFVCLFLFAIAVFANAQPPAHYYDSADGKTCAALKSALKQILTNGHMPQPYDNLYSQYETYDIKPRETGNGSANVIWDIYSDIPDAKDAYNYNPANNRCGNYNSEGDCYNREHTVPQSWFDHEEIPALDYNQVFPTDGFVNNRRSNYLYGEVSASTWTSTNGSKLGESAIAGISGTVFEPIDTYKGDVARAFFYFVTRYQDKIKSWSNNTTAFSNDTFPSVNIFYLQMMIQWNNEDPISEKEISRNNGTYLYQHNRNPYIDHPEYVNAVWNSGCAGLGTLPANLIYFTGRLNGNTVTLNWQSANEINLYHYEIEKSFNGISFTKTAQIKSGNNHYTFQDDITQNSGSRIYYRLKKTDKDGSYTYSSVFSIHIPASVLFTIMPNPAKENVTIKLNKPFIGKVSLSITDATGKAIHTTETPLHENACRISISSLMPGTYFITVSVNGERAVQKLIVR